MRVMPPDFKFPKPNIKKQKLYKNKNKEIDMKNSEEKC